MSGKRILVIDDQQDVIDDYLRILTGKKTRDTECFDKEEAFLFKKYSDSSKEVMPEESYRVSIAFQGKEGVDLARKAVAKGDPYIVAFIDMRMPPGIDGMETLKKIWEIDPRVEGVIVTAYTDRSRREIVNNIGNPDRFLYLKKPFDHDEIRQLALCLTEKWRLAREGEKRFRTLYEGSPDLLHTIDLKGNLVGCNRAYARAFGSKKEDLIGRSILPFFTNESRPVFERALNEWLKTHYVRDVELWLKPMAGKPFPVLLSATAIYNKNGELIGSNSVYRDITKQKQAEEALKESEENYKALFQGTAEGILVTDIEKKRFRYANPAICRMLDYTEQELKRMSVADIHPKEALEGVISEFEAQARGEKTLATDIPCLRKDGTTTYADIKTANVSIDGRQCNVSFLTDTTERKRVEEAKVKLEVQLQQAQKMEAIGVLAGGIAHNFNNLLMAIQGNVSLMLFDIDSSHPHYEFLTTIEDEIMDGAQLAKQLLGYARKGRYFPQPINLNELVERISEVIGGTRREIHIHRELVEDLYAIEADQSQIEQVLMNLFVNAADAMLGGGDLILKTANATHTDMGAKVYDPKPGDYVQLTVTDTGSGMDKETQERIFEPFFTTKEMGRGTGLGLASVYGIIKGHGGYIDIDSGLGRGTTFTIYLPATDGKIEKTIEPAQQIVKGNGTILLVDDEDRVMDVGTKVLTRLGYTVLEARSGQEAIEIYKENKDKIALVLLDMVMPDVDGGETYDRMKEINPNVKVLLSSGYSIDSEAKEILERGCNAFIQKPFGMQELSQVIREVLDKK